MSIDGITRKWCSRHQKHDRCFVERDAAADWQARALAAEAQVAHYREADDLLNGAWGVIANAGWRAAHADKFPAAPGFCSLEAESIKVWLG